MGLYHLPYAFRCLHIFPRRTSIHSRFWWLFPSAIFCGVLELVGWSGRLWSSTTLSKLHGPVCPFGNELVVAPTPLVAANFILLGRIVRRLGPQYSRLTPRRYTIIFVSCDIIALLVQAMGAGIASGSIRLDHYRKLIYMCGTYLHRYRGGLTLYASSFHHRVLYIAAEFLVRYTHDQPVRRLAPVQGEVLRGRTDKRLHCMLQAMITMTIFIDYLRVVEFADGWNGKVISTQWVFNVFDGIMIVLAMYTLNIFHPGIYLRGEIPLSNEL
ncbi:RTA-like protein [Russula aff. rugulosa BPL654]|nr:RTA-like protein [Russula aff. rugulosa BPL654]